MKYYFDYRTGECLGFKYHPSCGGKIDQEVFDYRPECIRNGYTLQDWATACWGSWQPVKRSQKLCKQNPCPSGTACRVTGAAQPSDVRESVCCNTTLLGGFSMILAFPLQSRYCSFFIRALSDQPIFVCHFELKIENFALTGYALPIS
uniref:Uncharacterized protein n=1 Tax=Romanomermis culicivorax TaxID=13658 RepID=A0A915L610_ROMCU